MDFPPGKGNSTTSTIITPPTRSPSSQMDPAKTDQQLVGCFLAQAPSVTEPSALPTEPILMVAELHAIKEVLVCAPAGTNVCVAMDLKAAIEAITMWSAKTPCRR